MAVQDLKYKDLIEKIIGCAMKVHRYFGSGFPEVVYKRARIEIELRRIGISCLEEVERDIIYGDKVIHKKGLIY